MRLLACADFHGSREAVEKVSDLALDEETDLIIVAGDIANNNLRTATEFLGILKNKTNLPTLFVPGNLDTKSLADWHDASVQSIHGRAYNCQGFVFLGLGGASRGPFYTPFEYDESEAASILDEAYRSVKEEKLILVSHCPPKNTSIDRTFSGVHAGSISVRRFMEKAEPILVICAHIHEGRGVDRIGETRLVNTGAAFQGYYATLRLDEELKIDLARFSEWEDTVKNK